jgi:predicted AlkP superfamily phosphohydrolase/phosphomutase
VKPRVVIFGLDGGAFAVLDDLVRRGVMPYLGEFLRRGARAPLMSTVPPLTPPAWTTCFTGRSPGHHGITNFLQFESAESKYIRVITSREIRTPTIMTLLSQAGLRAGCLNLIAHNPPPRYNGYVVPGWVTFRWIKKYSHPEGFLDRMLAAIPELDVKDLGMDFSEERKAIQGASLADYEPWINMHIRRERQWFNILRHQMMHEPCDFEAVVFDGVDKLQHLCWPYIDPSLAPPNPDESFLRIQRRCWDYFRQIDDFLRETVKLAGREAHVLVVSDHGFTGSDEVVYINTWLEQQGYLTWSDTTAVQSDESAELGRARPYHLTFFDLERTRAYAVLASTNGIHIQVRGQKGPHGIAPEDYEGFRAELIDALLTRCVDPVTSDPIVRRVWKREEAFAGSAMDLAPDLTLELRDFGFVSVLRGAGVVKKRPVVMGTHHPSGVMAACGPGIRAGATLAALNLLDIAPTVLHLLHQPVPDDFEGQIAASMFTDEFTGSHRVRRTAAMAAQPGSRSDIDEEGYQDAESQEQIMMRLKALGYIE